MPEKSRLFHKDGIDMEYMNALMQSAEYQKMQESRDVVLFPAYISRVRSLNRNLFPEGKSVCRVVMHEWNRTFTEGDRCLLNTLADYLEIVAYTQRKHWSGRGSHCRNLPDDPERPDSRLHGDEQTSLNIWLE